MDLGFQILRRTQLQPLILGPRFKQQTQISARRNIQFSWYRNPSLNHTMFDDDGDDWWSSSWWLFCVCKYIHIILDNRYDIIIYTYTHNIIIITIVCILAMVAVFEGFWYFSTWRIIAVTGFNRLPSWIPLAIWRARAPGACSLVLVALERLEGKTAVSAEDCSNRWRL